jgi:hypothetical protein
MLDELGDVLFQVVFLALLLEERGEGDLAAVAESCTAKLIRRHPHVFGDTSDDPSSPSAAGESTETSAGVLKQWEQIKQDVEGRSADPLAEIPENLPSLLFARKVLRRTDPGGSSSKAKPGGPGSPDEARAEAEREVGEALLGAVRRSRELGVDPELALRAAAKRLASDEPGS